MVKEFKNIFKVTSINYVFYHQISDSFESIESPIEISIKMEKTINVLKHSPYNKKKARKKAGKSKYKFLLP